METKPYLIFGQNSSLYGVEAFAVKEIFFLPELTPIPEAPRDIVGIINLRGEILPIMDLNIRFGHAHQEYSITDSVIVLEFQESRIGLIVNQVREVQNLAADTITTQISYGRSEVNKHHHFITGVARSETEIIMLLDLEILIRYSEDKHEKRAIATLEDTNFDERKNEEDFQFSLEEPRAFCPNATPEERAIFRERAHNLRRQEEGQDFVINKMPLAVFALNQEYFGLNLEIVREFSDIRKVTPIPCTPTHIMGNMNLRGEIVTLVDIRAALKMPVREVSSLAKAIIVQSADVVAGIVVDEVLDVMYLNPSEMAPVPAALHTANDDYLRGTAPYREKMMSILDLQKMLTKGELVVDEEV